MSDDLSAVQSDTHPSVSSYEYSTQCSFKALHSPNIGQLVMMLKQHRDYVGFRDKIDLLSEMGKDQLVSTRFWDPFAVSIIAVVRDCVTSEDKLLSKMKRKLVEMERSVVNKFITTHAVHISSDAYSTPRSQALLHVLCTAFIELVKHDMCKGITQQCYSIIDVVNKAFLMADADIHNYFATLGAGNRKLTKSLLEFIYYIAGWHAHALKKASVRRRRSLRELMCTVFENATTGKDVAKELCTIVTYYIIL